MLKRCLALFLLLLPAFAFAQTAAEMDTMLDSDTVSSALAARFILCAAELMPPEPSGAEAEKAAYDMAVSKGWIKKAAASDAVTMKTAAFLIMKAFNLKGGIMYSLFKSPRYAYREMVYRKLIGGQTDQNIKVSGAGLLSMLDNTLSYTDGGSQ